MSESTAAVLSNGNAELSAWDKPLVDFKDRYSAISTTDAEQYEPRRLAVQEMRKTRTAIEERRLELGRPLLKAKKDIDIKAAWLIDEIWKIEQPLKLANEAIDEEAARLKRIAEQDERDQQLHAATKALEAHKNRIAAESETERARLNELGEKLRAEHAKAEAEAKAEREKLAAEKAKADAEAKAAREEAAKVQAENLRQREALAAEQKRFRDEQEAALKLESDRLAAIDAEKRKKEAEAQAEAKRIAHEAAKVELERLEAARREAMLPDVDRIRKWADQIDAVIETAPAVNSDDGFLVLNDAFTLLANLATKLREFGS